MLKEGMCLAETATAAGLEIQARDYIITLFGQQNFGTRKKIVFDIKSTFAQKSM